MGYPSPGPNGWTNNGPIYPANVLHSNGGALSVAILNGFIFALWADKDSGICFYASNKVREQTWTQPKLFPDGIQPNTVQGTALSSFADGNGTQTLHAITVYHEYTLHRVFTPKSATSSDGTWSNPIRVLPDGASQLPNTQPALVQYNNELICAFTDKLSGNQVFTTTWTPDKNVWSQVQGLGEHSTGSPALAVRWGLRLHLIFPESSNKSILKDLIWDAPNKQWFQSTDFFQQESSSAGASGAANDDDAFLAFVASNDSNNNVLVSRLTASDGGGNRWMPSKQIGGQIRGGDTPSITTQGSYVFVVYTARNSPFGQLWWSVHPAGSGW